MKKNELIILFSDIKLRKLSTRRIQRRPGLDKSVLFTDIREQILMFF